MDIILHEVKRKKTGLLHEIAFILTTVQAEMLKPLYKKAKSWEDDGQERLFDLTIAVHFKPKTSPQLKLYWEFVTEFARAQDGRVTREGMEEIHAGICLKYCPRVKARFTHETIPKRMSDLNVKEMTMVIEGLIRELWEAGIPFDGDGYISGQGNIASNLRDWRDWRNTDQETDLDDTYLSDLDYRQRVPYCEACLTAPGKEIAHIVTEKTGGTLEAVNILHLCYECHRATIHMKGMDVLITRHPHLKTKIEKAKEIFGRKPLAKVEPEIPELGIF